MSQASSKTVKESAKAVFLDRDGTINIDPGYINNPSDLILYPFVPAALKRLREAGYLLVLVSNQSGVARGKITPEQMRAVQARLDELLAEHDVELDHEELCHHHPDENCDCRKPKAGLILTSAKKLGIDLSKSYMVGDKITDVESGLNAGVKRSILVRTGNGQLDEPKVLKLKSQGRVGIAKDLAQAVDLILAIPET